MFGLFSKPTPQASASRSSARSRRQMHLTMARSAVSRTGASTVHFFRQRIYLFPILAIVLLAGIGLLVRSAIERTIKANLSSQLETMRDVEASMLLSWLEVQQSNAQMQADREDVREEVAKLLAERDELLIQSNEESGDQQAVPATDVPSASVRGPSLAKSHPLTQLVAPSLATHDYQGYVVCDRNGEILASSERSFVEGHKVAPPAAAGIKRVFEGQPTVVPPYPSVILMSDEFGVVRSGVPVMWAIAPIRDRQMQVVAALGFRIRPERDFTRILSLGRIGNTGETYAVDRQGRMLSNSRFDEQLVLIGLLKDQPNARSILELEVRHPGGNILEGFRPQKRRAELPLTKIIALAFDGEDNVQTEPYGDYRGVPSYGAAKLLKDYDIVVATEVDASEADRPIAILQWTFLSLIVLLAIAALAIFLFTLRVQRLQQEARAAAVENQQLGQYSLEEKLGSGGMGTVYKGRHAVLRRPTAIKMLQIERISDASIERFEREVRITCQLNHPNTVQIYDYGRTPEGIFYYAMEYLDGIDLQKLVEEYGPQSEARVVHILLQVCGSLYEAHTLGLVHRDIKPANIMLNRRGCEPDVAKVLDFGLVKALEEGQNAQLTVANSLTGTPLYMSPEAIQTPNAVDARSDLYALGAVGYYLLTGAPPFDASNIVDLCRKHVSEEPEPVSKRARQPISEELDATLLACLDKQRARRPQTARELASRLERCVAAGAKWSFEEADLWWGRRERGVKIESDPKAKSVSNTNNSAADRTIIGKLADLDQ